MFQLERGNRADISITYCIGALVHKLKFQTTGQVSAGAIPSGGSTSSLYNNSVPPHGREK
ncbi:MAG: hypothetical protein DHS20C12_27040 [Pseudohongiella sp.]|nr:MAG: hypothetical protein DHS20C12_27040 [Pseudohongiella sp.]